MVREGPREAADRHLELDLISLVNLKTVPWEMSSQAWRPLEWNGSASREPPIQRQKTGRPSRGSLAICVQSENIRAL